MKKGLIFLTKFFLIFVVLEFALIIAPLEIVENLIAGLIGSAMNLKTSGNMLLIDGQTFSVNKSCTGFVSGIILASIVFSLKKPSIGKKTKLFLLGFIVLFLANIPRLVLVLWSAKTFGSVAAEYVHTFTWFLTSAIVIILWYALTKKIAKVKKFNELL